MARHRSLWPREHGAYAQLGVPLATALVLGVASPAAAALALGACLAFLAHEPLLVATGGRGARLRDELAGPARLRLGVFGAGAIVLGVLGLVAAPRTAVILAAVVAMPVALMIGLAVTRALHGVWGELVAAIALPGASAPIAVTAGLSPRAAIALWAAWSLGYATAVLAVHEVLRKQRRAVTAVALCTVAVATAGACVLAPQLLVALPIVVLAAATSIVKPPARRLRMVGVLLVIASVASAALAVSGAARQCSITMTITRMNAMTYMDHMPMMIGRVQAGSLVVDATPSRSSSRRATPSA